MRGNQHLFIWLYQPKYSKLGCVVVMVVFMTYDSASYYSQTQRLAKNFTFAAKISSLTNK